MIATATGAGPTGAEPSPPLPPSSLRTLVGPCATRRLERRPQRQHRTASRAGGDLQLAAEGPRAASHADQPVAIRAIRLRQSLAVVCHAHEQVSVLPRQLNLRRRAAGVAREVADRLLEHEEHVAPY